MSIDDRNDLNTHEMNIILRMQKIFHGERFIHDDV